MYKFTVQQIIKGVWKINSQIKWISIFLFIGLMIGPASAGFRDSQTPEVQQKNVITVSGHGTVDTYPDEVLE